MRPSWPVLRVSKYRNCAYALYENRKVLSRKKYTSGISRLSADKMDLGQVTLTLNCMGDAGSRQMCELLW